MISNLFLGLNSFHTEILSSKDFFIYFSIVKTLGMIRVKRREKSVTIKRSVLLKINEIFKEFLWWSSMKLLLLWFSFQKQQQKNVKSIQEELKLAHLSCIMIFYFEKRKKKNCIVHKIYEAAIVTITNIFGSTN